MGEPDELPEVVLDASEVPLSSEDKDDQVSDDLDGVDRVELGHGNRLLPWPLCRQPVQTMGRSVASRFAIALRKPDASL